MEGCYEKAIVGTDRKINSQTRVIFRLLPSRYGRLTFVSGERSWLLYRHDSCAALSSKYGRGTYGPLSAAVCILDRSRAHLRDLVAMRKSSVSTEVRLHYLASGAPANQRPGLCCLTRSPRFALVAVRSRSTVLVSTSTAD
jgi:uncharacterized protein YecT (DUF1311 family)